MACSWLNAEHDKCCLLSPPFSAILRSSISSPLLSSGTRHARGPTAVGEPRRRARVSRGFGLSEKGQEALSSLDIFNVDLPLSTSPSLSPRTGKRGPPRSLAPPPPPPPPPLPPPSPPDERPAALSPTLPLSTTIETPGKKNFGQTHRDALETCDALAGLGRDSCFASFGIDSQRVDAYYGPVSRLEAALSRAGAGLRSFGDESEEDDEEGEGEGNGFDDDDDDDDNGGGFRWPSLPGMPRW